MALHISWETSKKNAYLKNNTGDFLCITTNHLNDDLFTGIHSIYSTRPEKRKYDLIRLVSNLVGLVTTSIFFGFYILGFFALFSLLGGNIITALLLFFACLVALFINSPLSIFIYSELLTHFVKNEGWAIINDFEILNKSEQRSLNMLIEKIKDNESNRKTISKLITEIEEDEHRIKTKTEKKAQLKANLQLLIFVVIAFPVVCILLALAAL